MLNENVGFVCSLLKFQKQDNLIIAFKCFITLSNFNFSHAKPGILFNVELVPEDDVEKLKDVFHGFENFALKSLIDELDALKDVQTEEDINVHVRETLLSVTLLSSSLMSG